MLRLPAGPALAVVLLLVLLGGCHPQGANGTSPGPNGGAERVDLSQLPREILRCTAIPDDPTTMPQPVPVGPMGANIPVQGGATSGQSEFRIPAGAIPAPNAEVPNPQFTVAVETKTPEVVVKIDPSPGFLVFHQPASLIIDYGQWQCPDLDLDRNPTIWRINPKGQLVERMDTRVDVATKTIRTDSIFRLSRYVIAID